MCRTLVKKCSADIKAINTSNCAAYDLVVDKTDAWDFLNPIPKVFVALIAQPRSKDASDPNNTPLKIKLNAPQDTDDIEMNDQVTESLIETPPNTPSITIISHQTY